MIFHHCLFTSLQGYLRATLLQDVQDVTARPARDQLDSGYPTTTSNSRDDLNAMPNDDASPLNAVNTRSLERRLSNRLSTIPAQAVNAVHQNPDPNAEDSQSDASGPGTPTGSSGFQSRSGSRQEETHFWVDMISVRRSHKVSESFHTN